MPSCGAILVGLVMMILSVVALARVFLHCLRSTPRHRRCIAVLARKQPRGKYHALESRQRALDALPWTAGWDQIIFHEGNINPEACGIDARYVDVSATFRKLGDGAMPPSSLCKELPLSQFFLGYRSMCLFWFDDFLSYVDGYDMLLRIDDDCRLLPGQAEPTLPVGFHFATTQVGGCDATFVTDGMHKLFKSLQPETDFETCVNPYTNVMCVDLAWARATRAAKRPILDSQCIKINQWGDLPLWGAYLKMLGESLVQLGLSYKHDSHGAHVTPNF